MAAPHEQRPVVQRLRVRYAKRGRLRFTSHRDFARAFERALRRSGVPIAYSQGFSPHPKVSYVGAAATGVASDAEYLEIGLADTCDPAEVRTRLDAALPPGLDVLEVVPAAEGSLADRIEVSSYAVRLAGVAPARLQGAVDELLRADSVAVERVVKDGRRTVDVRAALVGASVLAEPGERDHCAILKVVVRHVSPAVRPDDVVAALRTVAGLVPPEPPLVTRLAQGQLGADGQVTDPLAPDRYATGTSAGPAGVVAPQASPDPASPPDPA